MFCFKGAVCFLKSIDSIVECGACGKSCAFPYMFYCISEHVYIMFAVKFVVLNVPLFS